MEAMKKIQVTSIYIVIITVLVMGLNRYVCALPDWAVKIDGSIMLVGLFFVSYSTVKCMKNK